MDEPNQEYPKWVRVPGKKEGEQGYKVLVQNRAQEETIQLIPSSKKHLAALQAEPHEASSEPESDEGEESGRRVSPMPAKKK